MNNFSDRFSDTRLYRLTELRAQEGATIVSDASRRIQFTCLNIATSTRSITLLDLFDAFFIMFYCAQQIIMDLRSRSLLCLYIQLMRHRAISLSLSLSLSLSIYIYIYIHEYMLLRSVFPCGSLCEVIRNCSCYLSLNSVNVNVIDN